MSPVTAFLLGLALTMGTVFLALFYLKSPLQVILTDLCGTVERARFWTAFSNATLFLVPLALALGRQPGAGGAPSPVFAISDQIESAVVGLIISIVTLGVVLSWHISQNQTAHSAKNRSTPRGDSQANAEAI